jgi:hypothetical protein
VHEHDVLDFRTCVHDLASIARGSAPGSIGM